MPQRDDRSIWVGNNAPDLVWDLPDEMALDGAAFFLSIAAMGSPVLSADSETGALALDPSLRRLRWSYSAEQSRKIPLGRIADYEIERRQAGLEITEIFGTLTGLGGLNGDAATGTDFPGYALFALKRADGSYDTLQLQRFPGRYDDLAMKEAA